MRIRIPLVTQGTCSGLCSVRGWGHSMRGGPSSRPHRPTLCWGLRRCWALLSLSEDSRMSRTLPVSLGLPVREWASIPSCWVHSAAPGAQAWASLPAPRAALGAQRQEEHQLSHLHVLYHEQDRAPFVCLRVTHISYSIIFMCLYLLPTSKTSGFLLEAVRILRIRAFCLWWKLQMFCLISVLSSLLCLCLVFWVLGSLFCFLPSIMFFSALCF